MSKPQIRVVVAEILSEEGAYLITQRRPEAAMPLLWEFPGGKVGAEETDHQALDRALDQRLGVKIDIGEQTMQSHHEYEDYVVVLASYRASLLGTPTNRYVHDHRWVLPEDLNQYPFPGADQATIDTLLNASL